MTATGVGGGELSRVNSLGRQFIVAGQPGNSCLHGSPALRSTRHHSGLCRAMGEEALDSPRTGGHTVRAVRRAAAPITAAPLQDVRLNRMDLPDHGVTTTPQPFSGAAGHLANLQGDGAGGGQNHLTLP